MKKEKIIKSIVTEIYEPLGYEVKEKRFDNRSDVKRPIVIIKNGKKTYIEIVKRRTKKIEKELFEFHKGDKYAIVTEDEIKELDSIVKAVRGQILSTTRCHAL